jgi:hypothetical protein
MATERQAREPIDWYTKWCEHHLAHPEEGRLYIRFAREWRAARPDKPCSIELLQGRVRWFTTVDGRPADGEEYKVNNGYAAYYARWVMSECPDLRDPPIFELRRSDADRYFAELFEDADEGGSAA